MCRFLFFFSVYIKHAYSWLTVVTEELPFFQHNIYRARSVCVCVCVCTCYEVVRLKVELSRLLSVPKRPVAAVASTLSPPL